MQVMNFAFANIDLLKKVFNKFLIKNKFGDQIKFTLKDSL